MLTVELHQRLRARGSCVCVNLCHPGTVHTEVTRNYPALVRCMYRACRPLMRLLEKSPAEGAFTTLHLAAQIAAIGGGGEVQDSAGSGHYWVNSARRPLPKCAEDTVGRARLWDLSVMLSELPRKNK